MALYFFRDKIINSMINKKTTIVKIITLFIKKNQKLVHRQKWYGILTNVVKNKIILIKKAYPGGEHGRRNKFIRII